jgi:hypothetical protein
MTLMSGTTGVKPTARSSTARPQEIAKSPFGNMKKLEHDPEKWVPVFRKDMLKQNDRAG